MMKETLYYLAFAIPILGIVFKSYFFKNSHYISLFSFGIRDSQIIVYLNRSAESKNILISLIVVLVYCIGEGYYEVLLFNLIIWFFLYFKINLDKEIT